jgi:intracellular multiplication protein IcmP
MASPGQSSGGAQSDNTYYILWVMVIVFGVAGLIWYFFDEQLKQAFLAIKRYELIGMYYALNWIPQDLPYLGKAIARVVADLKNNLNLVTMLTPSTLGAQIAGLLSDTTGNYLRWFVIPYLLFLSYFIYKSSVQLRLKRTFDMKSLLTQERTVWPQVDIATRYDILNEDLDSGRWAMNMSPVQFCRKFKLITAEYNDDIPPGIPKSQIPEFKITLDKARAERAFAAQLGRPWQGATTMPPHRRALLAAMLARGGRDTKDSFNLLQQLARTASEGALDCTGADAMLQKHLKSKRVQELFARHAYEYTVFVSALLYAREDGVLASADFLWIKPIDRRLWYVLNSVGRQTPSVEAAGVFSHWNYEKILNRPLSIPMVADAVHALGIALTDVFYTPDEKEREEIKKRHETNTMAQQ